MKRISPTTTITQTITTYYFDYYDDSGCSIVKYGYDYYY